MKKCSSLFIRNSRLPFFTCSVCYVESLKWKMTGPFLDRRKLWMHSFPPSIQNTVVVKAIQICNWLFFIVQCLCFKICFFFWWISQIFWLFGSIWFRNFFEINYWKSVHNKLSYIKSRHLSVQHILNSKVRENIPSESLFKFLNIHCTF